MPGSAFLPDLSRLGHAQLDVATPLTNEQRQQMEMLLSGLTSSELKKEAAELLSRAKRAQAQERRDERAEATKQRKTAEAEAASLVDADRAKMSTRKQEQAAFLGVIRELEVIAEKIVPGSAPSAPKDVTFMQANDIIQIRNNVFRIKQLVMKDGDMRPTKTFTGFAISIINTLGWITQPEYIEQNTLESASAILAMLEFIAEKYLPALLAFFPKIGEDYPNWPDHLLNRSDLALSFPKLLMRANSGLERMQERVVLLQGFKEGEEDPAPS